MRIRPRRIALASIVLATAVLGASLLAFSPDLREIWLLHRLATATDEVQGEILSTLETAGTARSVPALAKLFEKGPWRARAAEVLARIYPRLSLHRQVDVASLFWGSAVSQGPTDARALMRTIELPSPEVFPVLVEDLSSAETMTRSLASHVLVDAWPRSREHLFRFAEIASDKDLFAFFSQEEDMRRWRTPRIGRRSPPPVPESMPEVIRGILREHPKPEARCAALAFCVQKAGSVDPAPLVEAYEKDRSQLVRRAALRMTGYLGEIPGGIDIRRLIEDETDTVLRAEAIQARGSWATKRSGIDLWDGIPVRWPGVHFPRTLSGLKPFHSEETAALRGILRTEANPLLRDAASIALAGACLETYTPQPDLRVHEWTVWHDPDSAPAASEAISGLPHFVQRRPSFLELRGVLFFHSTRALPVDFQLGRSSSGPFSSYPPRPTRGAAGGLDACGLRIGYGAPLEGELKHPGEGSFWHHLRDAGATPVALHGEHERFLFHESPVAEPAPLRVDWERYSRTLLVLGRRPADTYPRLREYLENSGTAQQVPTTIHEIIVIEKRAAGSLKGKLLRGQDAREPPRLLDLAELALEGKEVVASFHAALVKEGLSEREAESLVRTWKREFFETEGVRVLTIVPRWLLDAVLPLRMVPVPGRMVRVGVVWKEMGRDE